MDPSRRRRATSFAVPLILGLILAPRAAAHVRTVDFVLLFACGAAFGIGLMGIIQHLRAGRQPISKEPS
jgi:hypothetical protein